MSFLSKLNSIFTYEDKKYLFFLFFFSILIACIETLGVSIIMPLLSVIEDNSLVFENKYYKTFYEMFEFTDVKSFIIAFGSIILIFYFVRALLNSLNVYLIMYFINSRYKLIVNRIFRNYLSLPYVKFIKNNTSYLTKTIVNEAMKD